MNSDNINELLKFVDLTEKPELVYKLLKIVNFLSSASNKILTKITLSGKNGSEKFLNLIFAENEDSPIASSPNFLKNLENFFKNNSIDIEKFYKFYVKMVKLESKKDAASAKKADTLPR